MKEFHHKDIYQQMEIVCYKGRFTVKPVASDGIPPSMLRKEYWDLHQSEHNDFTLVEASGVNEVVCSRLLALYSPSTKVKNGCNAMVGRWYIPFVFVKEEMSLSEQSVVRVEAAYLNGKEAKYFDTHNVDGLVWFKTINSRGGRESVVKLSYPIWERIKWEESIVGCNGGGDEKVERVEEYRGGVGGWKRFGCYVLVERFVLRRMDGNEVLMVDF
ncbi:hypothetical protein Cni_G06404 [Canna indica]|uniref:Uncharacterized protein n=1 Tax=Canna indica TaxID=4628 RepID=A0AAQ3JWW3_9LILI|nr:hypothetical protein Cni_G06404 [Canna indica]